MISITTNTQYNFTQAESDLFSWSYWDGTNGNTLTHKPSGRQIYKMHWLDEQGKMSEKVGEETVQAVKDFRAALKELQNPKSSRKIEIIDDEPKHGVNGYCRKCHSYCYGDCGAS